MKTQFLVSKQEKKILLVAVCCILFSFIDNLWLHNFLVQSKENVLLKPISGLIVGGFFMTVCSIACHFQDIYLLYLSKKSEVGCLEIRKVSLVLDDSNRIDADIVIVARSFGFICDEYSSLSCLFYCSRSFRTCNILSNALAVRCSL